MSSNKKELNFIVITGPTATGKTKVAVDIANQYNGEIISADSRQIYKGMDIGTGKDLNEYIINNKQISYHLIDILDPNENYIDVKNTLSKYQLDLDVTYLVGNKDKLKPIWDYFYVPVGNVETKRTDLTWILHSIPAYLVLPEKNTTLIYTEFNIDSILTDLNSVLN